MDFISIKYILLFETMEIMMRDFGGGGDIAIGANGD